jgi:hypothetical protein
MSVWCMGLDSYGSCIGKLLTRMNTVHSGQRKGAVSLFKASEYIHVLIWAESEDLKSIRIT